MNTSLSTGCVDESSSLETLGMSESCELFHGTSTSDFGASSFPRIDIPDIFTSPPGCAPVWLPSAAGSALPSPAFVLADRLFAGWLLATRDCVAAGAVAGAVAAAAGVLAAVA